MTSSSATARIPSLDVLPILSGLLLDAAALVERGAAAAEDVDTAMRLGAGHPAGPFEVMSALPGEVRSSLGVRPPAAQPASETPLSLATGWSGPVGLVGTGHMACGIAEVVARSAREVRVLARSAASGEAMKGRLAASLDRAVSRGRLDRAGRQDVLGRISVSEEPVGLTGVDVVVEAVAEDLDVKADVLTRLDAALPPGLPLATNTSSLRVADLRAFVAPTRPMLALHFFNPAPVMKLVEVVVPHDGAGLQDTAVAWARDLGKTPITCTDSRGFVVNRLLIPFLNDAVRLHERGVPVDEVDRALTEGAGHPMGPMALIDLIGLDVTAAALDSMAAVEDDPRLVPADNLRELVAAGRLGRKSGAGFHTYPGGRP